MSVRLFCPQTLFHAAQGMGQRSLCRDRFVSPSRAWRRPSRLALLPVDSVTLAEEEGYPARGDRRNHASYFLEDNF